MSSGGGRLCGETALITGGGRGLGLAMALAFVREGASVALVARSPSELALAAREVESAGGVAITRCADVTDESAMADVVDDVRASLGPITVLVNNAGTIGPIAPFGESTLGDWWRCVEVNLRGPAVCTHLVVHDMAARGRGRIINVVSGAGTASFTYFSAYVASKTALVRWTESIAAELAPYGVRVFAMEPGTVVTAMSNFSVTSPEGRRWIPWFKGMFDAGLNAPIEHVAERAVELAAGTADVLSGRYLPLAESLETLVANAPRIVEDTLYSLRISRLPGAAPSSALRAVRARSEVASPSVVRLTRRLPVEVREAFALWRDGSAIAAWFLPSTGAEWINQPRMELRRGGEFRLEIASGGERFRVFGIVEAVAQDESITLRWNWESTSPILGSGSDTIVTVTFVPARGGTDVVVTHEGLPNEIVRDAYIAGWRRCLDGMHRLVADSQTGSR